MVSATSSLLRALASGLRATFMGLFIAILALPPSVQAQPAVPEPAQEGEAVASLQFSKDVLGGAFGLASRGGGRREMRGLFVAAKRWLSKDLAEPAELSSQDSSARIVVAGADDPAAKVHRRFIKARGGRFMAVSVRSGGDETSEVIDLDGRVLARVPRRVVALSSNARFGVLGGNAQVAETQTGKIITLGVPAESENPNVFLAEDSDAFAAAYRSGKSAYVAPFAKDGKPLWRKSVAEGVSPAVRNIVVSPAGDLIAVIAGEIPTDHLTVFGADGKLLWTTDMPPGNYAMRFSADGNKLLVIHRDGHVLYAAADGAVQWERPLPLPVIAEKGTLIATALLVTGDKFVVATRSVLATEPGKRPHQTVSRENGPDLIYTVGQDGQIAMLMNRPHGAFLIEQGSFHYEPVIALEDSQSRIYYLTKSGLRSKAFR